MTGPVRGVLTPDSVTPAAIRTWVRGAMDLLTLARPVMDRANVFPVADADTGTNMWLTLGQGSAGVDALPDDADAHAVLSALAQGALLGARGNSGVILSEYLRGFAHGARGAWGGPPPAALAAALEDGARCAYDAVGHPRHGTILTAAAGASDAAEAALADGADLLGIADAARAGAHGALRRSADDLDVLHAAGVLDAGAYGLVLVLDALWRALGGDDHVSAAAGSMTTMTVMTTLSVLPAGSDRSGPAVDDVVQGPGAEVDGEFEVMYVLGTQGCDDPGSGDSSSSGTVARVLRDELATIGDSVAVVGGPTGTSGSGGLWHVHVHTDRPLDALRVGEPWNRRQVVVRSLAHQVSHAAGLHEHEQRDEEAGACTAGAAGTGRTGVVACTTSPGLVSELARSGAVVVLHGDEPVTTAHLRRAVEETGATDVLLLPADASTVDLAHAWASGQDEDRGGARPCARVRVVESASDLHVVAAMVQWAASAPEAGPLDLVASLGAAVASLRTSVIDADAAQGGVAALRTLLDRGAATPATVLTMLVDALVPDEVVDDLVRQAQRAAPGIETVRLSSGRRSTTIVLGAE